MATSASRGENTWNSLPHAATVHRVYLQTTARGKSSTRFTYPYTRFADIRDRATSIAQSAGFTEWRLAVGEGEAATERPVVGATAAFFDFFDAPPVRGRYFSPAEDQVPRGADVSVISYGYWMSELGGRSVIGDKLQIGPLMTTIIGVAPKGFVGVSDGEAPAIFLPITTSAYAVNHVPCRLKQGRPHSPDRRWHCHDPGCVQSGSQLRNCRAPQ